MGINMPAKTVVFTAMRKFDGTDFRWVGPGEYIQMSGRAGRRGLDDRGIVIQMMDEKIEEAAAKEMMSGNANPLASTFHLGHAPRLLSSTAQPPCCTPTPPPTPPQTRLALALRFAARAAASAPLLGHALSHARKSQPTLDRVIRQAHSRRKKRRPNCRHAACSSCT